MAVVSIEEVKQHLNITGTASDAELPVFIDTAQQIVEDLVGPVEPTIVTQTMYSGGVVSLNESPVISITTVTEYGVTVSPSLYVADLTDGSLVRLDGRRWYAAPSSPLVVVYQAGRTMLPAALKWAIMEEAAHLWRATQSQRGGRARGSDIPDAPTGYALPNRVREVIEPFLLLPAVG